MKRRLRSVLCDKCLRQKINARSYLVGLLVNSNFHDMENILIFLETKKKTNKKLKY